MQIPGYKFTAARLTTNPVEGSPLEKAGFAEGDVITRLDNTRVDNLAELERHERDTNIRYIKAGTTTVQLTNVYIPTDKEALQDSDGVAP
jgi:C-terminal processing protease CtpA/Prc